MTFIEAAIKVLHSVGKPLHYKKITEIAIEKNYLSHVGKTPEMIMSLRLTSLVQKDRDNCPIIKVKTGIFALRNLIDREKQEEKIMPDSNKEQTYSAMVAQNDDAKKTNPSTQPLPGAEFFSVEDDDDEPILATLEQKKVREKKIYRLEKNRKEEKTTNEPSTKPRKAKQNHHPNQSSFSASSLVQQDLADDIEDILKKNRRNYRSFTQIAQKLVEQKRLKGKPEQLIPTIMASIHGSEALKKKNLMPPRFHIKGQELGLVEWELSREAKKVQVEFLKIAKKHADLVRHAFLQKLRVMSWDDFSSLIATWLHIKGIRGLREIQKKGASPQDTHLSGTLIQENLSIPIAIYISSNEDISRESVIQIRNSLAEYKNAQIAWIISLGSIFRSSEKEIEEQFNPVVKLYAGINLVKALEEAGVGIYRASMPFLHIDPSLYKNKKHKKTKVESTEIAINETKPSSFKRKNHRSKPSIAKNPQIKDAKKDTESDMSLASKRDDLGKNELVAERENNHEDGDHHILTEKDSLL